MSVKKKIKETYGLIATEIFSFGPYKAFRTPGTMCLIVPVSQIEEDELYELYHMSQYLYEKADPYVAQFMVARNGSIFMEHDNQKYVVFKCANNNEGRSLSKGRELARFHQKGRSFPYEVIKTNRIGQWKQLWEKRLDQLENFWRGKVQAHPLDHFEKLFIESFPYYVGLAENSIQYLVDTELDDEPQPIDSATICHHRFTGNVWRQDQLIKLPIDWVFDHASRDIAEYMRDQFFNQQTQFRDSVFLFAEEYDRTTPLSAFSWRLMFSRLLLPVHYFECIENYYLSPETENPYYERKLKDLLSRSSEYEEFLAEFHQMLSMRTKKIYLPNIEWLSYTS
ncbi:spore coat putative kinase YutH [Metabacillus arenae]|uniref:Spore coat protein YutH n=1 Tax=Metabacillus arenae TaxID=2771434 RepID=A0A926RWI2_9BACI|nr:spore coat protein YutH [Metabacillus arenae]MBD1380823.1 spore coat protein YutH [Metabacillus arenae]